MKRFLAAIATALLIVLSTAGCMKLDMQLTVTNNDTVNGQVTLAFSKALVEYAKQNGGNTDLFKSNGMFSDQLGVTNKPYSDSEFEGTTYYVAGVPLKKFASKSASTSLKIVRDGDNIVVSGELDSSGGQTGIDDAKNNPLTAEFFKNSSVKVAITLPGEIKQTNGVRQGNKITWQGQLGDKLTFQAIAYSPKGINPVVVSVVGGGVVLVAAGIVLYFALKKRKPLIGEAAE
jgi:hypothetical protein